MGSGVFGDDQEMVFMYAQLKPGEQPPKEAAEGRDDLSQEELLKLPVHIPHRPKKDPRELKILDPACGSGHFLLYCFDLLLTIYEEAYKDPELGPAFNGKPLGVRPRNNQGQGTGADAARGSSGFVRA